MLQPLDRILSQASLLFEEIGGQAHRLTKSLYIGVDIEDLDRQGDVENALPGEQILFESAHNELDDIVLGCYLSLVDQDNSPLVVNLEVVLEHDVLVVHPSPPLLEFHGLGGVELS